MINCNSKLLPTVNNGRTTSQKKFDLMVFSLIEVGFSGLIYLNFDELLLTSDRKFRKTFRQNFGKFCLKSAER